MKAVFLDLDTLGPTDIDLSPLRALLPAIELFPYTQTQDVAPRIATAEIVFANKVELTAAQLHEASGLKD